MESVSTDARDVARHNTWLVAPTTLNSSPEGFEAAECADLTFYRRPRTGPPLDRCFEELQGWFFLFDGPLLNREELLMRYKCDTTVELLHALVSRLGVRGALSELRGPFSGAFLDLVSQELFAFANQTGDAAAYVLEGKAKGGQPFRAFANSFDLLASVASNNEVALALDERAARMMLSYGYMVDDATFAEEVRRVLPGTLRKVGRPFLSAPLSTEPYWELNYRPDERLTLGEATERLDILFRQAVRREFEKDREMDAPRHLVDMSGGLDSRMVNVVASSLGYENFVNLSFSQSGSADHRYALEYANLMRNDFIHHPIDTGNSLLHPRLNLRLNSGAASYPGVTGGRLLLQSLNPDMFGVSHTGQLGDVVFGSYASSPRVVAAEPFSGASSKLHEFPDLTKGADHSIEEVFVMRRRGFLGMTGGSLLRSHYLPVTSPFLDVDVLDEAFSVPLRLRHGHRLYKHWIAQYYPEALATPTTRQMGRLGLPGRVREFSRRASAGIWNKVQAQLARQGRAPRFVGGGMNPAQRWYLENSDVRDLVASYWALGLDTPLPPHLRILIETSFTSPESSIWDKLQAVSVLAMCDEYQLCR